jgi:KDO2-lipid IV(A) lauroyltransferase
MKYAGFILTYSLIWLLSLLPERVLFLFADLLCLLAYHVVGYRKKVVFNNLRNSFPEKEPEEIRRIAKGFYHHLSDLILESAVSHFYSQEKALEKVSFRNLEILEDLYAQGKMVMAVMAHYGNWEYTSTLPLKIRHPVLAIYKPLHNKYFDRMVIQNRTRFGVQVTPMEKVARKLITHHRDNDPVVTYFLSDQSPVFEQIQYWTKFLGLDTPVYLGTEKLARKFDAAVVFLKVRKVKRGRYEIDVELICESPGGLDTHEITDRHVKILEELIREEPRHWLWSHRRWKHSYEKYLKEREPNSHPG